MKRMILIVATLLLGLTLSAQSGKEIYEKYSSNEGATCVYVSPAMFDMIKTMDLNSLVQATGEPAMAEILPLVKRLEGMYVVQLEDTNNAFTMKAAVKKFVDTSKYQVLMQVKESGQEVNIYINKVEDIIKSIVLFVQEDNGSIFIAIDGTIQQQELNELVNSLPKYL
ncbi:MAG: DUF4252 domain-containing protein [Bacteroidales bacterium]|nr:DUF4252 domain-containing protein [Bacteroidales bacterium]